MFKYIKIYIKIIENEQIIGFYAINAWRVGRWFFPFGIVTTVKLCCYKWIIIHSVNMTFYG